MERSHGGTGHPTPQNHCLPVDERFHRQLKGALKINVTSHRNGGLKHFHGYCWASGLQSRRTASALQQRWSMAALSVSQGNSSNHRPQMPSQTPLPICPPSTLCHDYNKSGIDPLCAPHLHLFYGRPRLVHSRICSQGCSQKATATTLRWTIQSHLQNCKVLPARDERQSRQFLWTD